MLGLAPALAAAVPTFRDTFAWTVHTHAIWWTAPAPCPPCESSPDVALTWPQVTRGNTQCPEPAIAGVIVAALILRLGLLVRGLVFGLIVGWCFTGGYSGAGCGPKSPPSTSRRLAATDPPARSSITVVARTSPPAVLGLSAQAWSEGITTPPSRRT